MWQHTYLFHEAKWQAQGTFYNNAGTAAPFKGSTQITHDNSVWKLESKITLYEPNTMEFFNTYDIVPFTEQNRRETDMTCFNPSLGKFSGKIIVIEDSLLVHSHTQDYSRMIIEDIRKVDNNTYVNHGALVIDNVTMSSWILNLHSEEYKLKLIKS